jgi:hypothetical protein
MAASHGPLPSVLIDADNMFPPRALGGHPVVSVPDSALTPGTSMTPCPTQPWWGIQLVIFYPKIVCSGGQSSCVDLCMAQAGEGCFTTFHSHFQDMSRRLRVKIARPSIGNFRKLIGLTLTSQLIDGPEIAHLPSPKSPAPRPPCCYFQSHLCTPLSPEVHTRVSAAVLTATDILVDACMSRPRRNVT